MPKLIVFIILNLILLNISNISSANENGSNFSCKWENKNETACIEIIGLVQIHQILLNQE